MSNGITPASLRRTIRKYVRLDCAVIREHDFRVVAELALDLSTFGMLARAKMPVLTGEELIVSFKPPRSNRWFDAEATVTRVIHGRRPGDSGVCLGIEFHNVSVDDQHMLFQQLRGLDRPEPLRAPRPLAA